jgi:hypothetical protein
MARGLRDCFQEFLKLLNRWRQHLAYSFRKAQLGMLVKGGLPLIDDYQPRPRLKSHPGHISRWSNYQAGANHNKKVAALRMFVSISQVLAGQGLSKIDHAGYQLAAAERTPGLVPNSIHTELALATANLGDIAV